MLPWPLLFVSCLSQKITLRCQVHFELYILPFSDSRILLLLSWYTVVVGTGIPWAARKCLVHSIWPIALSIATSSASVELFVLSFCLMDAVYVHPFPIDISMPLWLFMSGCTAYKLSTHQCGLSFASMVSVMSWVSLIYCIPLWAFYSHPHLDFYSST